MGTATSRSAIAGAIALAMTASACGGTGATGSHPAASATPRVQPGSLAVISPRGAFTWLRPAPAPRGWPAARIPSGAVLRYPPGWRLVAGDAGTATAVLEDAGHHFLGYLNITPRQADENPRTWASFRTHHNALEGERSVTELAAATGLRFRHGSGSCVRDSYITSTANRFVEIACLVHTSRAASVIVGAAPPGMWASISPEIERSISAFIA